MTTDSAPAGGSPKAGPAAAAVLVPPLPSWPWRRAALFLAGAAQLVTILAPLGADPIPATWSSLLLAVAPAPLTAAAAFAPGPVNLRRRPGSRSWPPASPGRSPTPGCFVPALVVLAVAAVKLWRERTLTAGERDSP